MEESEFEKTEDKKIEEAKAHLEKAKADLKAAKAAEEKARREEENAEHEIEEALQEMEEVAEHHHKIHFTLDGESEETEKHKMTPNEIIREYGRKEPANNYLVQIQGNQKISYRDKGDELIDLHNGMKFQIISLGPTPVSDGPIRTGVEVFVQGLRDLGYSPEALPGQSDHLVIDYEVQSGRFAGQKTRHGFAVPADFPMTPPSGPYISPHIHPIKTDGEHPTGRVHQAQAQPFIAGAGGEWQYWSRPFADWAQSKKSVATYMSHIWRLWDSQ